jgi:hypothetical protein
MSHEIQIIPDPEHAHLIEVWEPLQTKAPNPNLAQPYCCYANTVVFYVRPYTVRQWHHYWVCNGKRRAEAPGHSFEKWDEIETALHDTVIEFEGQKFRIYNGRVVWKNMCALTDKPTRAISASNRPLLRA